MTDEKTTGPGPTGFTQGPLSESVQQTAQIIEEWFEGLDLKKYRDAYKKLALSGTTGAMDALGEQMKGKSSGENDPVDATRFLADTWLNSMSNAWDATRDLSRLWQKDFARYVGQEDDKATAAADNSGTGAEDRKDEPPG